MCARPMAPPPSSARPIFGRGRGVASCCARDAPGHKSSKRMKTMRRMQASSVVESKLTNSRIIYECGAAWRFQQARMKVLGNFLFLQDIAAIDNQDLAGDVGSLGRGQETDRGGDFVGSAGAAERGMKRGDFFRFR